MKKQTFASSPYIQVELLWKDNRIQRVLLKEDPKGFSLVSSVECPPVFEWIQSYLLQKNGSLAKIPFSWEKVSPFSRKTLHAMQKVPFGKALSYKELASAIENPKAYRAVGSVCKKNPFPLFFPCHRIIGVKGLGGFAYGERMKKELLELEGYLVSNSL